MNNVDSNITIGRVFNIPIGLHWSWFLILALLTGSLSAGFLTNVFPNLPALVVWLIGATTSLLFFLSILAHELGHAFVAIRSGIAVQRITLFIMGGIAQIAKEPENAGEEFRIAIAGPVVSLVCALLAASLAFIAHSYPLVAVPAEWLARVNLALVAFNLIPGFPLDGGRVFRSILWKIMNNYDRATQFAGVASNLVAYGFIVGGIFFAVTGNIFNGLWLVFVGWFLQRAASASREQHNLQQALSHARVGNIMSRDIRPISPYATITDFVHEVLYLGMEPVADIEDQNHVKGLVAMEDIRGIPSYLWETTRVDQIMKPVHPEAQINPDGTLLEAMLAMDHSQQASLPVMYNGLPTGMISKEQVLRYLRTRLEAKN